MGSIWSSPEAVDAFVVPPAATIKKNLENKDDKFAADWYEQNVAKHVQVIKQVSQEYEIPLYTSFEDMDCGKWE